MDHDTKRNIGEPRRTCQAFFSCRPEKHWKNRAGGHTGRKRLPLLSLIVALAVAGCMASPPPPAFDVTLRLSPTPALIGPTRLILDITDVAGRPTQDAVVSIEGIPERRPGPAARRRIAEDEGAGRYVVSDFDLDVGGPWTLAVTVTDGLGNTVTRAFPISVFGGP